MADTRKFRLIDPDGKEHSVVEVDVRFTAPTPPGWTAELVEETGSELAPEAPQETQQ